MTMRGHSNSMTEQSASLTNEVRLFPRKEQDHATEDHQCGTDKQEDNVTDNQYPEFHDILELFVSCYFDRFNPFLNVDMKTMIQSLVRQSEPTTIRRLLFLLPKNEKGQDLGIRFFHNNNTEFWNAVAQWEKVLCDCDSQVPIETVPKILNWVESFLSHWNAHVTFAVDRRAEALRKSRSAHTTLFPHSNKRRKLTSKSGDDTQRLLSNKTQN